MNSYFASCEQQEHPELRGRPVAVVPVVAETTACIAASIEAKRFGIKTGTPVWQARQMCPSIVFVSGRTRAYVRLHHAILAAIDTVIPVEKVYSIDECACRLVPKEQDPMVAIDIAKRIKAAIFARAGEWMRCSIGIAPNRLLAKVGADMQKPDGLTVLLPEELESKLLTLIPRDLPGVGARMEARLRQHGIHTMADLLARSELQLREAWGSVLGQEWWYILRGHELPERRTVRRTLGHSHVLAPQLRTHEGARGVLIRLITKAAARLRHEGFAAGLMHLRVRFMDPDRGRGQGVQSRYGGGATWEAEQRLGASTDTGEMIQVLARHWHDLPQATPFQVAVTFVDLAKRDDTQPLFAPQRKRDRLSSALDKLDKKYGPMTVYAASMQHAKASAPSRIAFGSVPDLSLPDVVEEDERSMLLGA
jgi:DNA polymerase IV